MIHTMGCKSNQFEGFVIEENLVKNGFEKVSRLENADFYILNSCSVTQKSDNEALYLLRNAKHKNPYIKTVLTGCIAQLEKEKLLQNEFIDYVIGNDEKLCLADYLDKPSSCFVSDIMLLNEFNKVKLDDMSKTRASLKIQDGCDNRCAYCVIPFARGNCRSADLDFIIDGINNFTQHGFKEIVFTGIHIGLWGKDIGLNLLDLLKSVETETDLVRYRLGSLNPSEITDDLLDFLVESDKFCPHFHLSLQSACDKTLASMNRYYRVENFLRQIDKINSLFDLPFLGSDIITGFAGETDEDFEITRMNLVKSGLSQIHTFPYSLRKGTAGANMSHQVDEKLKEQRATVIKKISADKYNDFVLKNLGKIRNVLIEKKLDKYDGMLKGVTENYLTVHLDCNDRSLTNSIRQVLLKEFKFGKIYGSVISEKKLRV